MSKDKYKKENCKTKHNKSQNSNPNFKLELGEELNIPPRLKPSKTGSVSQNTARPISSHKKH